MNESQILAVQHAVTEQGLSGVGETELLETFCRHCNEFGLQVDEAILYVDTLSPALEAWGFHWDAKNDVAIAQQYPRSDAALNADSWRLSPFYHMLEIGSKELYVSLVEDPSEAFPILNELRKSGQTGYFALIHPLGKTDVIGEMDSMYSRWTTGKPGGFSLEDLGLLRSTVSLSALATKAASLRRIAQSLVSVYLGRDPGKRVLEGRIARGKVESITTVLWYSDMANFTSLSEQIGSAELISLLDDYAEAVILSVSEFGGDVLKLVGDGVLAIFNATALELAAISALDARAALLRRLERLTADRAANGEKTTSIYMALHVGEVYYGNIGSDERLDFTVIGPAVNEVCRIASASRKLGHSLLVSNEFLDLISSERNKMFRDSGLHQLKGVHEPKRLFFAQS